MLSVVIQALKKPVMFLFMLCKPFANRCWMYGGWALEITHLAHTNYHHLITAVRFVMKSRVKFIAELWRPKRACGAPWVRKCGNLPIRENLVIT